MKRTAPSFAVFTAASIVVVACSSGSSNSGGLGSQDSNGSSNSGGSYAGVSNTGSNPGASSGSNGSNRASGSNGGTGSSSPGGSGSGGNTGASSSSRSGTSSSGSATSHASGSSGSSSASSTMQSSSSTSTTACVPPTSGTSGFATRFWDCCKPSCGSSHTCAIDGVTRNDGAKDSCQGGNAYECYDMAPQVVSDSLAYAFAAFNGASCGTCFQLTFTGTSNTGNADMGSQAICGKSIIVQVVNTGGLSTGQFDLLIPGGGVGQNNACSTQWNASSSQLGAQFGGVMLTCEQNDNFNYAQYTACTLSACQTLFPNNTAMANGCEFIVNWMKGANNPNVKYTQVTCPSALSNASGI